MKINQGGSSQQGVNLSRVSRSDDGGSRILGNIHKKASSWKARLKNSNYFYNYTNVFNMKLRRKKRRRII